MDLRSILGYQKDSPFFNNPYIDINSNVISMENTPIDLWAIDHETGEKVRMKANRKKPYTFKGNVREIPMQKGGYNAKQLYNYLFDDEQGNAEQAPRVQQEEDIVTDTSAHESELRSKYEQDLQDESDISAAMNILYQVMDESTDYEGSSSGGGGFRTFATYQEGRAALENQLDLYKTGKTQNPVSPTSTLLHAMSVYAPRGDGNNDPVAYANFVAKSLGISPNTPISQIDTKKWADAVEKMEGNKTGNNPGNLRR